MTEERAPDGDHFGEVGGRGRGRARGPITASELICRDSDADTYQRCSSAAATCGGRPSCIIDFRFGEDEDARQLAHELHAKTNVLLGAYPSEEVDGYKDERVATVPALPVGSRYRHHLAWLHESLSLIEQFMTALASTTVSPAASAHAATPTAFTAKPQAFAFFRTRSPNSYPSAFVIEGGTIAYNLEGPLHSNWRDMHETLFHELFHVNDALHGIPGRGNWSEVNLEELFEDIFTQCGVSESSGEPLSEEERRCLIPFAPYPIIMSATSTTSSSSFSAPRDEMYAFEERTREVREYAAELALRYFLEHERLLLVADQHHRHSDRTTTIPPFKCATPTNARAWGMVVNEFFGGVDLSAACSRQTKRSGGLTD